MPMIPTTEERVLHVSHSQVDLYLRCPKKYEYRYIRGADSECRSPHLVFGVAIHEALATFYRLHREQPDELVALGPDGMAAHFLLAWDKVLDVDGPDVRWGKSSKDSLREKGISLMEHFYDHVELPDETIAEELKVLCDIVDDRTGEVREEQFVGYVDGVVEWKESGRVILEHKTAARRWGQTQLDYALQPSRYMEALGIDEFRFQVFLKTVEPRIEVHDIKRTEAQRKEAVTLICDVLDAINKGVSYRRRDWHCSSCEFRSRCG